MKKNKIGALPAEAEILENLPNPKPIFVDRKGFEFYFGIKAQTLANMAARGEGVPYFRRGKKTFYRVADIERWLTAHPVKTCEEI